MDHLESSVQVKGGEFPYIRFGTGKKNLVMLAGMSMIGLTGLGEPVSEMYRDYVDEYTVYVFDRLRICRTFGSGCWNSCTKSYNHQDSLANVPY